MTLEHEHFSSKVGLTKRHQCSAPTKSGARCRRLANHVDVDGLLVCAAHVGPGSRLLLDSEIDPAAARSETDIQAEIEAALNALPGVRVWRQNAGSVRKGRHTIKLAPDGAGDLSGIVWPGFRLEVEVKRLRGTQRESQEKFERELREVGGLYVVARSVEAAVDGVVRELTRKHISRDVAREVLTQLRRLERVEVEVRR